MAYHIGIDALCQDTYMDDALRDNVERLALPHRHSHARMQQCSYI